MRGRQKAKCWVMVAVYPDIGFGIAVVKLRYLQLALFREKQISFKLCSMIGHNKHGHVEGVIWSIQEGFNDWP